MCHRNNMEIFSPDSPKNSNSKSQTSRLMTITHRVVSTKGRKKGGKGKNHEFKLSGVLSLHPATRLKKLRFYTVQRTLRGKKPLLQKKKKTCGIGNRESGLKGEERSCDSVNARPSMRFPRFFSACAHFFSGVGV